MSAGRPARLIPLVALALLAPAGTADAASAWLDPANLSAPGQDAVEPAVAVDAAAGTVVAWSRSNGSDMIVQATSRPPGGAWAPAVDLSATGRDAKEPQVAVDPAGFAVAVWARYDGLHWVIQASSRPPGGSWTGAVDLSDSERSAVEPQVAVGPGGRAIAVWSRFDGSDDIVQSALLPTGSGAWTEPVDLSEKGEDAEQPQVGVDASGDAVAAWSRLEGTDKIAQAAFRPSAGGWQPADDLSEAGGDAEEPQLSVDPGGSAVVVWARTEGTLGMVQAADMQPGGGWQEADDLSQSGEDASEPEVALAGGRAISVWSLAGTGPYSIIQGAEQPAGAAWLPSQDLTQTGVAQTVVSPEVAIDPRGNAAAVWARSGASPTVIEGRIKPPGGPWSSIDEVSVLGSTSNQPDLALAATGDGASVWSRDDGANTIIQAAGFDGDGPTFPSLSIPPAGTMRQPVRFAAATFDNWSPVASIGWAFGDGGEGAFGPSVEHTFSSPGTYPISITGADDLGNSRSAVGTITIYRLANAARNARVRGRVATLMVHCPSPAGCTGLLRLIARVQLERRGRSFGKRAQVGRKQFSIGAGTSPVAVRLSRAGSAAVREAGRKGLRTQLTGPGIQHRLVLLRAARRR